MCLSVIYIYRKLRNKVGIGYQSGSFCEASQGARLTSVSFFMGTDFFVLPIRWRCCVTHLCVRRLPVLLQVNRVTNNTSGYLRFTNNTSG